MELEWNAFLCSCLAGELKTSTSKSSFEKTLRIPMIRSSHDPPRGSSPPLTIFNTRIATQPLSPPHAGNPVPTLQATTSARSTVRISDVTALSNQRQPPVRSPPVPPPLATTHQDTVTSLHPRDSRSTAALTRRNDQSTAGPASTTTRNPQSTAVQASSRRHLRPTSASAPLQNSRSTVALTSRDPQSTAVPASHDTWKLL